jgi:hypothetical protein
MRKFLALSLVLAGVSATAMPAFARDDARCTAAAQRLSPEAVSAKLAENGYKVTRIKSERGCYEVHATDKAGARVELRVDPADAKILRSKQDR